MSCAWQTLVKADGRCCRKCFGWHCLEGFDLRHSLNPHPHQRGRENDYCPCLTYAPSEVSIQLTMRPTACSYSSLAHSSFLPSLHPLPPLMSLPLPHLHLGSVWQKARGPALSPLKDHSPPLFLPPPQSGCSAGKNPKSQLHHTQMRIRCSGRCCCVPGALEALSLQCLWEERPAARGWASTWELTRY